MNESGKKEVYQYIKNFLNQKQAHSNYIDYYELFRLSPDMSIGDIQAKIGNKKIKKLFHPDQKKYIEEEFQDLYLESIDVFSKMQKEFSDMRAKERYDQFLAEERQRESVSYQDTVNNSESFTPQEEKNLERAIETTIYKYGFHQGYFALQNAVQGKFNSVTSDNDSRKLVKQIGSQKIREILQSKKKNIMSTTANDVIMDYFSTMVTKTGLKEKADIFYNACLETAYKYDLYGNHNQINQALAQFLRYSNCDGFTNENQARNDLVNSKMLPSDAITLMCVKMHALGSENDDYLFSTFSSKNTVEQINLFSDVVKQEAKNREHQRSAS